MNAKLAELLRKPGVHELVETLGWHFIQPT